MSNINNKKTNIVILFGGQSAEHEVSIYSAYNVFKALDKKKYNIILIGIDKKGRWLLIEDNLLSQLEKDTLTLEDLYQNDPVIISNVNKEGVFSNTCLKIGNVDVVFPVLHGPKGEDGTIQGLLKLAGLPFVGADVLGSAIGMDKDVMKRLLRDADLPIANFLVFKKFQKESIEFATIVKKLGLPFFVKPANLGSSVGISKILQESDFREALDLAFSYDAKIILEEYIEGREVECSVLGNEQPIASKCGEIVAKQGFYSYQAKYIDNNGAELIVPAVIDNELESKIKKLAISTFETLECKGMARVDFFVDKDQNIIINEINTIPGFTSISMYPKLWEATNINNSKLVNRLIELAIQRHEEED